MTTIKRKPGRPPAAHGRTETVTLRLSKVVMECFRTVGNKSQLVENLVRKSQVFRSWIGKQAD